MGVQRDIEDNIEDDNDIDDDIEDDDDRKINWPQLAVLASK